MPPNTSLFFQLLTLNIALDCFSQSLTILCGFWVLHSQGTHSREYIYSKNSLPHLIGSINTIGAPLYPVYSHRQPVKRAACSWERNPLTPAQNVIVLQSSSGVLDKRADPVCRGRKRDRTIRPSPVHRASYIPGIYVLVSLTNAEQLAESYPCKRERSMRAITHTDASIEIVLAACQWAWSIDRGVLTHHPPPLNSTKVHRTLPTSSDLDWKCEWEGLSVSEREGST